MSYPLGVHFLYLLKEETFSVESLEFESGCNDLVLNSERMVSNMNFPDSLDT
jgi:hypothetical protein